MIRERGGTKCVKGEHNFASGLGGCSSLGPSSQVLITCCKTNIICNDIPAGFICDVIAQMRGSELFKSFG